MANAKDTAPRIRTYAEIMAEVNAQSAKDAQRNLFGGINELTLSPCNKVKLPVWPETIRGMPNTVLRSALFGAIKRGKRAFQQRVKKASVDGLTVIHTGPQLDQADLDVWEQCLHLARTEELGTRIQFTVGSFLKAIDRSTGKSQHEWLKGAFARLSSSVVEIAEGKKAYFGPMLRRGMRDDETGRYVIEMNPDVVKLYGADGWSSIEFEQRRALKKQPLSQWLHGFYASHAKPFPYKVETLHKLCGSENKQLAGFRRELFEALTRLSEVTAWKWEIDGDDLVYVEKKGTSSQCRHLRNSPAK